MTHFWRKVELIVMPKKVQTNHDPDEKRFIAPYLVATLRWGLRWPPVPVHLDGHEMLQFLDSSCQIRFASGVLLAIP